MACSRCSGTSEEGTRSWEPPLCRHCLSPSVPGRAGEHLGGSPTLGCPPRGGAAQGRRAGPFATYWCGVSVGLGCRGAGSAGVHPAPTSVTWVLLPGEAPAPAGRSCRASLLTLSAPSSHPGTPREPEGDTPKPSWVAANPGTTLGSGRAPGCPWLRVCGGVPVWGGHSHPRDDQFWQSPVLGSPAGLCHGLSSVGDAGVPAVAVARGCHPAGGDRVTARERGR